jgi:8-oxo-dGTP pyrophosphatase MutT (NUDIX family)
MTDLSLDLVRDRLAGVSPTRADARGRIEAAVALTLAPAPDGELHLLLIKRAARSDDPWSGQMALPGGRREHHDRDLLDTARRETLEETAIDLRAGRLLGELDDLSPSTPHLPPILVRPFVFSLTDRPPVTAGEEVALHLWIACKRLAKALVTEQIEVRGRPLVVRGYRIGPHLVWGMTERILTPFLRLLTAP